MTEQSETRQKLLEHGIADHGLLHLCLLTERAIRTRTIDPEALDCLVAICVEHYAAEGRSSHQASETRTRLNRRSQRAESTIAQSHRRWMGEHGLRHQLRALARCEANCSPEVMHDAV